MPVCNICSRILSSNQRLRTHLESHHGVQEERESVRSDAESDIDSESMQSEQTDISDNDSISTKSKANDGDTKSVENDDDVDDLWLRVMAEVVGIAGGRALMNEEGTKLATKKTMKQIRDYVEDIVAFAQEIENSDVYDTIRDEKLKLEGDGYSEKEARIVAWKKRKYLIKQEVIEPFLELCQNSADPEPEECNDDS